MLIYSGHENRWNALSLKVDFNHFPEDISSIYTNVSHKPIQIRKFERLEKGEENKAKPTIIN